MRRLLTALLLIAFACTGLWAQSVANSQISGTVRDQSGGAVPGAEVRAIQTDTGAVRTVLSGSDGTYVVPSLPVGPYRLEVRMDGFSTYVQSGIVLQVNASPKVDPVLKVGSVNDTIQVDADAAMVETNSTGVGQVVNQQQVLELPLNGRQITQLITLAGGANTVQAAFGMAPSTGNLVSSKNYPNEALVSVAGGMLNGTTYLLDGGTHNDVFNNLNLPLPFPDAVQEFKVQTSALPAEYGQHSAGAVNVVSKSGTNEIHGNAFEFVRNGYFNARDFFAPVNDNLKRNQFGGTIGGPIRKNKLFFYLGYEATLIRSEPASTAAVVPTAAELTGDFTSYMSQCFTNAAPLKAPYVNNVLPSSLISPQALAMAKYFPVGPGPCGNVTYSQIANQNEHKGLAKIDYQINEKQTFFARFFVASSFTPSSYTGTQLSVQQAGTDDTVNSIVFGHTYTFNPTLLNTFHATLDRVGITKFQVPFFTPSSLGVQGIYEPLPNYSNINITGNFSSAGGFATPGLINTTTYQFSDDVNKTKGRHQIQVGANYIRPMQASTFCVYCNGLFTFSGGVTGNAMADFIAGQVSSFTQINVSHDNEKWNYIGLYAQDSWKVNSRLTLNYGLRWEPYLAGRLLNGHVSHFDMAGFLANTHSSVYPKGPAGTLFHGDSAWDTGERPNQTSWRDFAPRLGLAWDPKGDGNTVIRASYGILYDMPHTLFYYNYATEPPWGSGITLLNVSFANPWAGYPGGNPFPSDESANATFPTAGYWESVPEHVKVTYVQQWNLTVQKQLTQNWLLKASYLGNETVHLWTDKELNPAIYIPGNCKAGQYGLRADGPCSTTGNTNARRLFTQLNPSQGPLYGQVEYLDDGGTASYHAMMLAAEHRLSNHFSLLANYTWAHCIADPQTTELSFPIYNDPNNRRFDRGNCTSVDVHHNFNLSAILQSPHYSNRVVQLLAGDWQLSPIVAAHTGNYFSVTTGLDNALNGGPIANSVGQRPNQVLSDPYCAVKDPSCWVNPKAFTFPTNGTFGNMGVNNLQSPGYIVVDVALSRRFPIKEHQAVEFRAETFNIANHANFLSPSTPGIIGGPTGAVLNNSNIGKILGDTGPRVMQFALKYNF